MDYTKRSKMVKSIISFTLTLTMMLAGLTFAQATTVVSEPIEPLGGRERPVAESAAALSELEALLADGGGMAYVKIKNNNTFVFLDDEMTVLYGAVDRGMVVGSGLSYTDEGMAWIFISFVDQTDVVRSAYVLANQMEPPSQSQPKIAAELMESAQHFAVSERKIPLPVLQFNRENGEEDSSANNCD